MKILVTGGAGFIGGNFVHYMVDKYPEYQIVNLDLLTYAGNLETLKPVENKPNYKFVKGDIADREFIMDLFEKEQFDVVVNFAAESHVDRSISDPGIFGRAAFFAGAFFSADGFAALAFLQAGFFFPAPLTPDFIFSSSFLCVLV